MTFQQPWPDPQEQGCASQEPPERPHQGAQDCLSHLDMSQPATSVARSRKSRPSPAFLLPVEN